MSLFGQKKSTRTSRALRIGRSSRWSRIVAFLRDRGLLARLLMCVVAIVALLFVVEGWQPPFPYRLGDRAERGVAASLDFERVDRLETERQRELRESEVPLVFRHDPAPLENLPARLRTHLLEVVQAGKIDELPPETRAVFGLAVPDEPEGEAGPSDPMSRGFARLKAAVSNEEGLAGNRIDELVDELTRFVAPLSDRGVVDGAELDRLDMPADRPLAIVALSADATTDPANAPDRRIVAQSDVRISDLVKDTGLVGQTWSAYPKLHAIRPLLERWLIAQSPVTLHYDAAATQTARSEARRNVAERKQVYARGTQLVRPGDRIDAVALDVLRSEYDARNERHDWPLRIVRVVAVLLLFVVLAILNGFYVVRNEPKLVRHAGRLAIYLATIVLAVLLGRLLSNDPWRAEVIPVMAAVMIFAIAYDQVLAMLTAFTLVLVVTLSTVLDLGEFVVLMSVAATAIVPLRHVPSRSTLVKVGFWTGATFFLVNWGLGILESQSPSDVWLDRTLLFESLRGAFWCLVTGYLVSGSLPFIESLFGVVTDISLLEMGDVSHPLLQELVRSAPGTYNHSISVATIGEAAADRIGANGLLVRVGAYFHDIGKMLKPHYFVENMTEGMISRHLHLAPAMSTLVIIGHVKDGVDLARRHHMPQPLIDFIEQHHGTTLVEYFYREATRLAENKDDVEESAFRYPGPKPQSREAGVMMLADAVESASRTLSDPTPKRIEGLVHELTMKRLLDGQFDESSLTLSEIHMVEDSLCKSLIGIYHGRIKYPEQRSA